MPEGSYSSWLLRQEARALLTRLARVKPFALVEPMVTAAGISPIAQTAIEQYLIAGRRDLRKSVAGFIDWLGGPAARAATPADAQRRFALLRLKFNVALGQFDLFSDVLTQRSEHENGVWLAGLDVVAADALTLPGYYEAPPVICYLDRGVGAAIRRARTRLPGGGESPAAIIRVPRERMVGSGIASSLVHEVGHQAAALLDLVKSLGQILRPLQRSAGESQVAWRLWERWISEIVADFWSVAKVGVASTMGLMGVVSLPRPFVFRLSLDDPHPVPWMRVKLSCAMGKALYPHPQWDRLARLWEAFYPLEGLRASKREVFARLEATIPAFVALLTNHRPASLRGKSLAEVMKVEERQPERLAALYGTWLANPNLARAALPTMAFAVIGQARSDGRITPEAESRLLADLLTYWALRENLNVAAACARRTQAGVAKAV
jgi:hypothetical protein